MAKKRNSNSSSSPFLSFATFILFIVVGISFYLNSQALKRIELLESSYHSVVNRMVELEYSEIDETRSARPRNVISLEQTGSSASIKESISKVLDKSEFSIEGLIYCSAAEENSEGNVTTIEALYFKGGLVTFYRLKPNTIITPRTLFSGKGRYTINGLDVLATVILEDEGTQVLNLKITELTTDQKGVLGLSLSSDVVWRSTDCDALGITL